MGNDRQGVLCDLRKIAWTMADSGQWRGSPLLPAGWVAHATRTHVPTSWRVPPISSIGYGYLWFTGTLKARPLVWG
jgi:CubicO group peptidase (beta-lactamase class C family)